MTKTTISSKGHIAIPKAVRERLNLKAGTEISIDVQGQAMVLRRLVRDHADWRTCAGCCGMAPISCKIWPLTAPPKSPTTVPGSKGADAALTC
jgi:AbrB family looped-hinge helix DNA binding protein